MQSSSPPTGVSETTQEPMPNTAEKPAKPAKKVAVIEIFGPTIQGEGPQAGQKVMFVRFGGCDYRCTNCDSLHAVIPEAVKQFGTMMTADEIAARLIPEMDNTGTNWVVLSGGNPCMWDLTALIALLHENNKYVSLETQGTLSPDWIISCDLVVVSPKAPGMGEKFEPEKFQHFLGKIRGRTATALKIVIFSQQDIEFALEVGQLTEGIIWHGMRFFSLGNSYPPKLERDFDSGLFVMRDSIGDTSAAGDFRLQLMDNYRILLEDIQSDRRIDDWKFLPQMHVLAYGNQGGV